MDFPGAAGDSRDACIYRHRRRSRAATVELAAAAALRLAPDYLVASAGTAGAVPDPLRRIWTPRFRFIRYPPSLSRAHGRPHGGALGHHAPRGAGTIPARHARTSRLRPTHQREPGAMNLPPRTPA